MSTIDIDALLAQISPEAPSGETDLVEVGDPEYVALEILMKGTPERQFDNQDGQEAKGPNWGDVRDAAVKILSRNHDLRVAVFLTRALLHMNGIHGVENGLALLHGLVSNYWESLHPRLDPEDNNDPTIRNSALEMLSFGEDIMGPLKRATLCASASLGSFSYRDILIASGKIELPKQEKTVVPTLVDIEAAFKDSDLNALMAIQTSVSAALQHLQALKTELDRKIGDTGPGPDLRALDGALNGINAFMEKQLAGRQDQAPVQNDSDAPGDETDGQPETPIVVTIPKEKTMNTITGRQDVIQLLDTICNYYQHHEPGSPVPLLLKRARQLVDKNFMEIIQDLAPDSADKIKNLISGTEVN